MAEGFRKATDDVKREEFASPGGLYKFVKHFWPIIEPDTPMQEGWAMEAVCLHLEACADGRIRRLLVNISPGTSKSTLCSVMYPIWLWGPKNRPGERILSMSYSSNLPERDNRKKLLILKSREFKRLYGNRFHLTKEGEQLIQNSRTGYCMALGINSSVTGNRGGTCIMDDPNNIAEDSDLIRENTAMTFREAASNRLNDMDTSCLIVIQQRSHMGDVSGVILDEELDYEHLCIPAEFDGRKCRTSIGWEDPRTEIGESFWPERFPPRVLQSLRKELGENAWAGQYLQTPMPRGGGILKAEYWQDWEDDIFPKWDYVLASVDTAFTDKQENDPSGFTIWGCFQHEDTGNRGVVLLNAWRKHLQLCGPYDPKWAGETIYDYRARTEHQWGLIEWLDYECKRFKANKLLVEAKASGHSVVQAMGRLMSRANYKLELVDPGRLDKVARMHRVEPEFIGGYVWAPLRKKYAQMVVDECAVAPKGRTDDLVDSTTQAIFHLRFMGMLERHEEQFMNERDSMKKYKAVQPLYNI